MDALMRLYSFSFLLKKNSILLQVTFSLQVSCEANIETLRGYAVYLGV